MDTNKTFARLGHLSKVSNTGSQAIIDKRIPLRVYLADLFDGAFQWFAGFILLTLALTSCKTKTKTEAPGQTPIPIAGTWKLISGTTIENGDTVTTDYTKNQSFIKIINKTHFAFLQHDLNKGKDSSSSYSSGGGTYTLVDSLYTEHLEYCSDRQWEGNDFKFTITINNDTLIQKGIEKVENIGVNRINIEKYTRLND